MHLCRVSKQRLAQNSLYVHVHISTRSCTRARRTAEYATTMCAQILLTFSCGGSIPNSVLRVLDT